MEHIFMIKKDGVLKTYNNYEEIPNEELEELNQIAVKQLKKYEDKDSPLHSIRNAEPSNRADMECLLEAFPLYRVHEEAAWAPQENNKEV